jgi:hypothetical protein
VKFTGVRKSWHGVAGLIVLSAFLSIEFYTNLFEKSVGYYLKWENYKRPQLGRMWERDRQSLVAQAKIKSIRSSLDLQEETALGISSFKHLFEGVSPGFPLVVSREKFLQLYYDFPGQWSEQIISSYDLIDLDSKKIWDGVFLKRFGPWITIQFIDRQNIPIHELFLSVDTLFEVQATRTVKRGNLEDSKFTANRIFPISDFLPVLKSLDAITKKAVFPEPRWFLGKNYHVTRVGISEFSAGELAQHLLFGVEYDAEYYTGVLLIPVPIGLADNMMSQIEKSDLSDLVSTPSLLGESP